MSQARSFSMNSDLLRVVLGYFLLVFVAIGIVYAICNYGETTLVSVSPPPAAGTTPVAPVTASLSHNSLLHFLIALVAVIVTGQLLGRIFAFFGQPPVIGEVVAGILLGPSLLGGELSAMILPPDVAPSLGIISKLGVILYMFLVGVKLNPEVLRGRAHAAVAISHASIVLPFVCGVLLAIPLYTRFAEQGVAFTHFALFLGVALSITAFPVLSRILSDRGISQTKLGVIALHCAAVDDVTAWCLLATVLSIMEANVHSGLLVSGGVVLYLGVMLGVARPLIQWYARQDHSSNSSRSSMAIVLIVLLSSAMATEALGIHALFGAFVFGAMIPSESELAKSLVRQMEQLVGVLLLPAFFAIVGMRTSFQLLNSGQQWLWSGIIIAVATLGKFGGTILAARWTGLPWSEGAVLGTLMNTRGLMELIVLNVGLDLGVITPSLFAMLVMMALVTTLMTGPILVVLQRVFPDVLIKDELVITAGAENL